MANELHLPNAGTGKTIYAVISDPADGDYYDTSDNTFKAPNVITWTNADIAMSESGSTGDYFGTHPTTNITPGTIYQYTFLEQLGASPDKSVDLVIEGPNPGRWTGTVVDFLLTSMETASFASAAQTTLQTKSNDAAVALNLDKFFNVDNSGTVPGVTGSLVKDTFEGSGGTIRYNSNALSQAPAGGGGSDQELAQTILVPPTKYNASATFYFPLLNPTTGQPVTGVTFSAGDVKISKDQGAFANTNNLPSEIGGGMYSWTGIASEMQAMKFAVKIDDQDGPVYAIVNLIGETFGNVSAQTEFDIDQGTPNVAVASMATDAISSAALSNAAGDKIRARVMQQTLSETYPPKGGPATAEQLLFGSFAVGANFQKTALSTTVNVFALDASTIAMTFSVDDAQTPTERRHQTTT